MIQEPTPNPATKIIVWANIMERAIILKKYCAVAYYADKICQSVIAFEIELDLAEYRNETSTKNN